MCKGMGDRWCGEGMVVVGCYEIYVEATRGMTVVGAHTDLLLSIEIGRE